MYQVYFGNPSPLVVVGIDSILVRGHKFRVLYTDSAGQNYCGLYRPGYFFIEGLGHINGVFEYSYAQEWYTHPFENCPGVDTVIFNCDCAHLSGMAEEKKLPQFDVYPVPTSNRLHFAERTSGSLRIVNCLGETILLIDCRECAEVDVSSLQAQSYVLELETGNGIYRRKFIKN